MEYGAILIINNVPCLPLWKRGIKGDFFYLIPHNLPLQKGEVFIGYFLNYFLGNIKWPKS